MSAGSDRPRERRSPLPKVMFGLVVMALVGVVYVVSGDTVHARRVFRGRSWPSTELVSIDAIDHRPWDTLLLRFVDGAGNVDYAGWKDSRADVRSLDDYLSALSRAQPEREARREARLAFWINAYNALTIRGILDEYPAAIPDHEAWLGRFSFWTDLLLHVGDSDYSLTQIEQELLRPMREPRIHFALVCGARGCPRLLNRAYESGKLERQLRENSRDFFADPQKLKYDPSTGQLRLSPILKWYAKDFGESEQEVWETIAPYLPDEVTRQRPGAIGLSASYLDYDQSLNEQTPPTGIPLVPPDASAAASDNPLEEHD